MKLSPSILLTIFYSFLLIIPVKGQDSQQSDEVVGPEKGHLVIVGGGKLSDDIILKFIDLAGGMEAHIVIVPTAGGGLTYDDKVKNLFSSRGATNVTVLHTVDSAIADSDAFVEPLRTAKGLWFTGGRQWRLVDSYGGTKSEDAFQEILDRGGVIGGSSAGASIQGSFLARGDTEHNQIMMGDHQRGFGYLKNSAIDQHVLARNRQFDLFTILEKHPKLLGIGLDENTAIVVSKNEFEVIGSSYVLIYDNSFYSREGFGSKELPDPKEQFYFLKSGDRYDLKKRTVIK